jgi:hypothetical protein
VTRASGVVESPESAVFCSLESKVQQEHKGEIVASDVIATSMNGSVAWLTGEVRKASFTNCDFRSGPRALGTVVTKHQAVSDTASAIELSFVDSLLASDVSPLLLLTDTNVDAQIYNSDLVTGTSNLLVLSGCSDIPTDSDSEVSCDEF